MYSIFFYFFILLIGATEASDKVSSIEIAQIQREAIIQVYNSGNMDKLDHLMNSHGTYFPVFFFEELNLYSAQYKSADEIFVVATHKENRYAMYLDRSEKSPTEWYMSRLVDCNKDANC